MDDSPQEHAPQEQPSQEDRGASRLFRVDPKLAPGLYVVSTPIGNLRDITLRALDILASADSVCAEDTRVATKLLSAFGVSARLRPYHDHNGAQARPALLNELQTGARIALMSDAGTPLVSDPGYKLVREAAELGIAVYSIPGASAPLAALASSGLPTDCFTFAGFPPPRSSARKAFLRELSTIRGTLIFFEGPSRLVASLADMAEVLGGAREGAVARELTKKFEETRRGTLAELAAHYAEAGPPRGEIVVLVGPGEVAVASEDMLDAAIAQADESRPMKEVAAEIAAKLGLGRRTVYERMLELRQDAAEGEDSGSAGED